MNSKEHQQYLAGEWWQKRRRAFLAEVPFCETCGLPRWLARIAYDQDLHVHHLSYEHIGAEHDRDLQALCRRCHELEHQGRSDFKQPPRQAICRPCGKIHYNIYSDLCDGSEFKSLREFSEET
jgi:ribosomal protein L37E